MSKETKRIIVVLIGFCFMFISLIVYISYFQVFQANTIKNNSYNKRLWINEESILRGSILDRNGKVLVYSEKKDDLYNRYYLFGRLYSHVIGYSYREYGKTGLELQYNNTLLNINENAAINEIKNIVAPTTEGNSIKLTIDHELQAKARTLLKGKKGAIVAMNPTTGEVYAMVSLPDFDASNLREDWKAISESPDSPLVNRATQGLYPPGSIFKIIPTIAALNMEELNKSYECTGNTNINGYIFNDYQGKAHGSIDLTQALVKSCNTYFTEKAIEIGKDNLGSVAEKFLINHTIPFDIPTKKSQFPYKENMGETDIAASAIGQGKVLVTPLNMALMVSAIGNRGEIVEPTLIKEVISKNGKITKSNLQQTLSQATDALTANELKDMMVEVINVGTGTNAKIKNIKVAGKTGTAENTSGKSHAWFVGFAPADEPKVAVAVILEEEGSTGGKSAAPIAKDIMNYVINNIND
ncbi:penicillin-binding transpeptidase domain-containing protein [Tissierella sp.]|uniref:peptidoglycan D,D-transpeptidase FtsI family protein n=1 Tax=Tissierella sp. TaxID=41274 RepID=UPI00285C0FED|nr:penicillin-binding transpeptidase domain-containing protein [Tissierella sp.]MDR7857289.1 penicillin-binding transpeptidase domain-containing protein [Tissierella sp.]